MIDQNRDKMCYGDDSSGRVIPTNDELLQGRGNSFSNITEIPSTGCNRLARAERYGQVFFLKGLKKEYALEPVFRSLLRKEFELLVTMNHPNIVRAFNLEEVNDFGLCIVMEYVDGYTLDKYLELKPSLLSRKKITRQLLDALQHIHSHQQVHRDLKPANLMVTRNDEDLKIIDFGFADADRYVAFKEPAFSAQFASPEQFEGGELDCRSDIYSFGILLRMIFPHQYRSIAKRCTQYKREKRYRDVLAVKKALFSPWHRIIVASLAVLFCALIVFGVYKKQHFYSEIFAAEAPSGQMLNFQIRDSKAYVARNADVSGDLVIPANVQYGLFKFPVVCIDSSAFCDNMNLRHVQLPEGLLYIRRDAFKHCLALSDTLVLPESLQEIQPLAFHTTGITHLIIRSKLLTAPLGSKEFFTDCIKLTMVEVAASVDSLCEALFDPSNYVVTLIFKNSMTELPVSFIPYSKDLRVIQFPKNLRRIKAGAFYSTYMPRIVLPESVECLEGYVFRYAHTRYLEIGPNVREIGNAALSDMNHLDTLVFRAKTPPAYVGNIFGNINHDYVFMVPKESLPLYLADSVYAKRHPVGM